MKVFAIVVLAGLLALALAAAVSGTFQSDCLSDEMLDDSDIVVSKELSLSAVSGLEVAEAVATLAENRGTGAAGGDPGELRERRVGIIELGGTKVSGGQPVFLFGIHHDGAPHAMFPAPVGVEATITTPCSIVVVTPTGDLVFTSTPSYVIE